MTRDPRRSIRAAVALALVVTVLAACQPKDDPPRPDPPAVRSGSGETRHDLDPLVRRWPVLASATSATWMSGTFGDDRAPGPSTYWIDAVVVLDRATVVRLQGLPGVAPVEQRPSVVAGLDDELPGGTYLAGAALDREFDAGEWQATAYLAPDVDSVVLVALGE